MKNPHISIVLPIHNQADHLRSIIEKYLEALNKLTESFELILVANNCRDESVAICEQLSKTYESVRTVVTKEGGWGLAVKLGLKNALGEILCYTNSSRTAPKDLLSFLEYAIANPNNVIKANRKIRENLSRRIGSLLYNIECRTLFDLSCWDMNGTPKAFPRKFEKLLKLTRDDDLIDVEFNYICRRSDYPMVEIPIFSTKRHGGKSTTSLKSAYRMYSGAYQFRKSLKETN